MTSQLFRYLLKNNPSFSFEFEMLPLLPIELVYTLGLWELSILFH